MRLASWEKAIATITDGDRWVSYCAPDFSAPCIERVAEMLRRDGYHDIAGRISQRATSGTLMIIDLDAFRNCVVQE